jgi:hypothetical protein
MNRSTARCSMTGSTSKRAGLVSASMWRRARLACCRHAAGDLPTIVPMASKETHTSHLPMDEPCCVTLTQSGRL